MDRKKKLFLYQIFFALVGSLLILFTFLQKNKFKNDEIISKNLQKKIDQQIKKKSDTTNVFYDVKYSGLDLEGNRYTITSKEATNSELDSTIVNMNKVKATFYFKDDTVLDISSKNGKYNNKTLDMEFTKDVKAIYENSELYAEKAEFLNSKNYLIVSNDVKVIDNRGTMFADKLIFDIKKKTLNISSIDDKVIKSKVIYK
jgi:hypothetical protein